MNYWPNKSWQVWVSSGNHPRQCQIVERPWALIGADEACTIRVKNRRVPPVTYAAFAFVDGIEVWPLCALAYPHWGKISRNQQLPIGGAHVQLTLTDKIAAASLTHNIESTAESEASPIIEITSRGKTVSLVLNHRVAILGSDHPSTHRIRSAGLQPVDHAIVSVEGHCWLIDLKLATFSSEEDRIRLLEIDDAVTIGDISLSLRPPSLRPAKKERISRQDIDGSMDLLVHADTSENARETSEYNQATVDDLLDDEQENDIHAHGVSRYELRGDDSGQKKQAFNSDSETMTTLITDRLMKITHSRWSNKRLLKGFLFVALFLVAGSAVTWFAIDFLLPLIVKLEGY